MRIVFFGSPNSAIPSLQKILTEAHEVECVITQPDRPSGRGKKLKASPVKRFAIEYNIPVLQPKRIRKDPSTLEMLEKIRPDLNVVVAYGQIIPASIIYLPKHHSINLHFSLLPKYRGASPVQWAILKGDKVTGMTIFELNERMDEGDILTQREVEITLNETAIELEERLAKEGADLLVHTIRQIDTLSPQKQEHAQATYAPLIKKEDGQINWNSEAIAIERKIRAFTPWPSAFAYFRGKRVKVLEGRIENTKSTQFAKPGDIHAIGKEGISVVCGDGDIYSLKLLQPENRKAMSAYSFSLGAQIQPGESFD
jgi:methionyl-tRNA formyltransferase